MKRNLCMGCMQEKGEDPVCPHCGYEEGTPHFASYLPPNTMIDDRYLAGKVLSYNGESVIYIGYDTMSGRRVDIREYFPDTLAARNSDGRSVRVNEGRQIQFKAYMGDYLEMIRKLSRMRTLSCVVQVQGVVEANNTVYAVMEHIDGTTVRQYLNERGAMLTWQEASDLFLPMLKTLRLIHQDGLIHRGISADTILVTRNHTVKIDGFAISAVRAARTELVAELFPGFSAPEQYSTISPHGTWTDVYAVSALLYTVLTGQRPPEALIRSPEKKLMPPRERNETIPPQVSDTILEGLDLSIRGRIQDMDTLIGRLTGELRPVQEAAASKSGPEPPVIVIPEGDWPDEPEGNTAYYRPAQQGNAIPPESRKPAAGPRRGETADEEKARTRKLVLTSMAITLPILLLALILTFWILFGGRNRNPGNSSSETFEGSTVSDEWLVPSREESDRSEPGSMSPSSQEESSAESSAVSSEPEESSAEPIRMANFVGQKYADVLADAKNKAVYIFSEPEYVYSDQYAEGIVADQDVTPGIEITEGTRVSLKVSKGSQYVTLPSYEKKKEKEYLDELSAMGITNVIVSYREDPLFKQDGYVVGTSLGADGRYDITKKPVLEIYVSKKD